MADDSDDLFDALREWLRDQGFDALREPLRDQSIASLNRQFALPSPAAPTIDAVRAQNADTNAVFIDANGRTRECRVQDFRDEYLFPIPQRLRVTIDDGPPKPELPIASFRLSSIQDGVAVYRWAGLR